MILRMPPGGMGAERKSSRRNGYVMEGKVSMGESILQETLEPGSDSGGDDHSNDVLGRMPDAIRTTFSAEQIAAIRAATQEDWSTHPVNIRLRVPLLLRRGYLTLVAGICHRSPERHSQDRQIHPLRTLGNILFVGGCAALTYLVIIAGLLFFSAIFEY